MQLDISNLNKTYPNGVQALKGVSLQIGKGMFGLLGQNGAGKSTLMRTIATLQSPDTGSILFDGVDILSQPEQLRQQLGYLPQEFGVYPNLSAYEMLMHLAEMKGLGSKQNRKEVCLHLLQKVNLWDARHNNLSGYSGGMKQRFGIAQALLNEPKLLIVDEPTAGLDPMERNRFYNLLSEMSEDKIVILSTHIVEDVSTLCNEMAIIGQGEVLLAGKPDEVEASMQGKLWQTEIDKTKLASYQSKYQLISNAFHRGKMHITVVADGAPSSDFSVKAPSLEDVYFSMLHAKSVAV